MSKEFNVTVSDLSAFCDKLHAIEIYDEEIGYSYWQDGDSRIECGVCISGAKLIAQEFGGRVCGYPIPDESLAKLVGAKCGGHDFAVVGDSIVDWWGKFYEGSIDCAVVSIDLGIRQGLYLPEFYWVTMQDFR